MKKLIVLTILSGLIFIRQLTVFADKPEFVTICHAAGLAGTTKFVTLTIPYNAAYGQAGHFGENGTPNAGHEQDYEGECREEITPTISPTIGVTPTDAVVTPTPSIPSPSITISPSNSPTGIPPTGKPEEKREEDKSETFGGFGRGEPEKGIYK